MPEKIKKAAIRAASLEKDVDVENRRVRFCFMTEKPCENWYTPEVCLCEKQNADLTRFENGIAPVLFNHDRDCIIGRIDKIEFADKRAYAEVVIDDDEKSEAIFKKIQSGSLRGVSVGYIRQQTTRVEAGMEFLGVRYEERTDVTSKWELLEVSIVSVPADNDTGVGRDLGEVEISVLTQNNEKEQNTMEEIKQPIDVSAEREAARKQEAERTQTILGLCRTFHVSAEKQDKFIADGMSVDAVRAAILDDIAQSSKPLEVKAKNDAKADFRSAMADAMCLRTNVNIKNVSEGADQLQGMSLRSMAEEILERDGVSGTRHMDDYRLFERAMGSNAFQGIVDDFSNKVKLSAYAEQPFIFKNFVSIGSNKDFKPNYKYELGLSGMPTLMPHESAEFTYQEMTDAKVSTMVQTYGKAIKFTREIFINDALGEVADAISLQAGGFRRLQEKMFFDTLTSITYNTTTNKNLVSTNRAITAAAYGEMKVLMMKQKDLNGEGYIGVAPAYILAPVEQENEHLTLLRSGSNPAQNNPGVINPVSGSMVLFTSPYLSGNAYYAIARPNQMRGIEFTTLGGKDTIQSRTVVPSSYLGIEYQMYADWGFNVLSHKAFVKNANQ